MGSTIVQEAVIEEPRSKLQAMRSLFRFNKSGGKAAID